MYVGVKNLKKDIEDGVHLVLAQAGEKWVNYLEQYSDEVEQLIKLTRNESRFDRQGMRAATLIRSISIASLSPPQASPRAIVYRKVEQAPSPPFDFEFPLGGKLAMEA